MVKVKNVNAKIKNIVNITLVDKLDKKTTNRELLASSNDTKFIKNQIIKGISNPEEIFITNHFFVALIILN